MEAAAEQRYWEGVELLVQGRSGGVYILGYAAEMWLKLAFFRRQGALPSDVAKPWLGPAKAHAAKVGVQSKS